MAPVLSHGFATGRLHGELLEQFTGRLGFPELDQCPGLQNPSRVDHLATDALLLIATRSRVDVSRAIRAEPLLQLDGLLQNRFGLDSIVQEAR